MEWIALTETDLLDVMQTSEVDLSATVPAVLANLTAEIRGMIATWSPNTLSADATLIPPSFKARALALARWRILTSVPDYQPDEARRLEYEAAEKFFNLVSIGKIRPEPADDATTTEVPTEKPAGVEIVSSPGSRTGRDRMNGI